MAISVKQLVKKYRANPEEAKKHLQALNTLLQRSTTLALLSVNDVEKLYKIRLFMGAVRTLAMAEEITDEELTKQFGDFLKYQNTLKTVCGDETLEEAILGFERNEWNPEKNKQTIEEFDTFFGTGILLSEKEEQESFEAEDERGNADEKQNKLAFDDSLLEDEPRQRMNQRMEHFSFDSDDSEDENTKTASSWIKEFKKIGDRKEERDAGRNYLDEKIALIMAARKLAKCVRGDKTNVLGSTGLTREAIEAEAKKLKDHETYRDFLKKIKSNSHWYSEAKSAIKAGHGGGLDDMFTRYLAEECAPGKMPNDGIVSRYLPTLRRRIEGLKAQEMHARGDMTWGEMFLARPREFRKFDYARASAEILVLRNMSKIERDHKKQLEQKIVGDGSLLEKVDVLARDKGYQRLANSKQAVDLFPEGHGGAMIEKMRSLQQIAGLKPETEAELNRNTIGAEIGKTRKVAQRIAERLENPSQEVQDAALSDAKDLIARYYMLNSLVAPSKNKSYDFSHLEENLLKDAPWGKLSHNVAIPASIEQMTKKDALKVMNDIATKSQRAFFGGSAEAQKEKPEKGQVDAASEKSDLERQDSVVSDL